MNDKYLLVKTPKRNIFVVTIVADSNDADYITTSVEFSKEAFDDFVADDLIYMLKNFKGRLKLNNYDGDYDYIPHSEYGICHTLKSVDITHIDNNGETWDVKLNWK
ncbi:hypothetical protein M5X17_27865 [Paenibacillus alvei]|uniref:hypothetical protein n=1 Tax=Paenibacillus alvei TaxID=44250 RepID=UPI00227E3713|nr:hypothetical protein [Paenibacillus alvei]MCY9737524.1 hypothetical protein [Paenibacillus alvei]